MPISQTLDAFGTADVRTTATLVVAAFLSGLVRGFTGFGFAMVFVPLATLVVTPVTAIGMVWVIDAPFALPLAAKSADRAEWREVAPLLAGATVILPLGVWLLTHLDPTLIRWIVAVTILGAVAALASGWRYHGRPSAPLSLTIGGASGLTTGLAGLGGLPLALFWLGSQTSDAAQTRHNLMAYFGVAALISGVVLAWTGVLTWAVAREALLLLVPYGAGILLGVRGFRHASDTLFRRIAYGIIAIAAVLALPILEGR